MIRGMYTAASGMITCQAQQDSITNNIANVNTSGYKSQQLSLKTFDQVYISNKDGENNKRTTIGTLNNGAELNELYTNYNQGTIEKTGIKTDFALQGEGFFVVQRQNGNETATLYTRDGNFMIDSTGYLVTTSGDRVLGSNGGTLGPIYVGSGSITAATDGTISVDGVRAGKLAVVNFPKNEDGSYANLEKFAFNLYEGNNATIINNPTVVSESLEKSNVSVVEETSNLMGVMRRFESNTTVLKTLDSTLEKAVSRIGSV